MATVPESVQAEKVAAKVFGDEALKHCQFDTEAAVAIASIVQMVLKANRQRLGMTHVEKDPPYPEGSSARAVRDQADRVRPSRPTGEQPVVGKA